jgi:hypothetical protein
MIEHDPVAFATGISGRLAARSRHLCLLLGAGTSSACGLPGVAELQKRVLSALDGRDREDFSRQVEGRNLEQGLSRLRRIAALLVGSQELEGMTSAAASQLDAKVCKAIIGHLDVSRAKLGPALSLASWLAVTNFQLPVEVFTVNYDLVLEHAMEQRGVPYFDGFVGSCEARFHTDLVEAVPGVDRDHVPSFFVRLWKLHGSVNWMWNSAREIVRLGQPATGSPAAIYPSDAKYEESRRVPFVVLQDRFRRALNLPETVCIVAGYSFGDAHLNELIFKAASRRERSEVLALCYDALPKELVAVAGSSANIQALSQTDAIIGGRHGKWKAPSSDVPGIWEQGKFVLPDFAFLGRFLARSASRAEGGSAHVAALLGEASPA